jgi:hypothetical protein
MIWNETRSGVVAGGNITSITYPQNEFNTGADTIQARSDLPFVYAASFGSLTEALNCKFISATNGQQPQNFSKPILNPIAAANLEIGNNSGVYDFRANTLKNVYSANEDVTSFIESSGTTSEDIYSCLFVTNKPTVTNSIGQRVDAIITCSTSGTINETIANFSLTPENELVAGNYRVLGVDAVSTASGNALIYGELNFKGIELGVPFVPRTAPKQNIHPINNLPIDEPYIFNSVTNFPSASFIAANSASSDVEVTLRLQRVG